jgi:hypothetical protein
MILTALTTAVAAVVAVMCWKTLKTSIRRPKLWEDKVTMTLRRYVARVRGAGSGSYSMSDFRMVALNLQVLLGVSSKTKSGVSGGEGEGPLMADCARVSSGWGPSNSLEMDMDGNVVEVRCWQKKKKYFERTSSFILHVLP